jgi:hypothetical protein
MKEKNLAMRALLAVVVLLAGCAGSMKMLPDGRYLNATTVGDTLDRSATRVAVYKVVGKDDQGNPIFEEEVKKTFVGKNADGTPAYLTESASSLAVGPTVGGQAAVAVAGGVATALTQGMFAIRAAKINADAGCKGASCGTTIVNQVRSGDTTALSMSAADAAASLRAGGNMCGKNGCGD